MAKRGKELATAERITAAIARLGISHRAWRMRELQKMYGAAEEREDYRFAAQLLEIAAKEAGDWYSNRRILIIVRGGAKLTDEQKRCFERADFAISFDDPGKQ